MRITQKGYKRFKDAGLRGPGPVHKYHVIAKKINQRPLVYFIWILTRTFANFWFMNLIFL